MNGEVLDQIEKFLDQEEDTLPPRVTNQMLLLALRQLSSQARSIEIALHGAEGGGDRGALPRLARVERIINLLVWVATGLGLALLGSLGRYLFEGFIN